MSTIFFTCPSLWGNGLNGRLKIEHDSELVQYEVFGTNESNC